MRLLKIIGVGHCAKCDAVMKDILTENIMKTEVVTREKMIRYDNMKRFLR